MVNYINIKQLKKRKTVEYKTGFLKDGKINGRIVIYIVGYWVFFNYSPINSNHPDLEVGLKSYLKNNSIDGDGFYYRFYIDKNTVSNSRLIDDKIKIYCRKTNSDVNLLFSSIVK